MKTFGMSGVGSNTYILTNLYRRLFNQYRSQDLLAAIMSLAVFTTHSVSEFHLYSIHPVLALFLVRCVALYVCIMKSSAVLNAGPSLTPIELLVAMCSVSWIFM